MFFFTENLVFVSFFMGSNMRANDPIHSYYGYRIQLRHLSFDAYAAIVVLRMIESQNYSLRNFQMETFFLFVCFVDAKHCSSWWWHFTEIAFLSIRFFAAIEKWIKINEKFELNAPSLIPNFCFDMKTTRPYWLLQRNRTHLSLVKNAHLHFYTRFFLFTLNGHKGKWIFRLFFRFFFFAQSISTRAVCMLSGRNEH